MKNTNYVCGFMFNENRHRVALIQKTHPEWQNGKLNGIGGHIEDYETPIEAMAREFKEETGLETYQDNWSCFCKIRFNGGSVCFFKSVGNLDLLKSITDEKIVIVRSLELLDYGNLIPNLHWLIPMARLATNKFAEVTE